MFNFGNVIGVWFGGMVIGLGVLFVSLLWVGVVMVVVVFVFMLWLVLFECCLVVVLIEYV